MSKIYDKCNDIINQLFCCRRQSLHRLTPLRFLPIFFFFFCSLSLLMTIFFSRCPHDDFIRGLTTSNNNANFSICDNLLHITHIRLQLEARCTPGPGRLTKLPLNFDCFCCLLSNFIFLPAMCKLASLLTNLVYFLVHSLLQEKLWN